MELLSQDELSTVNGGNPILLYLAARIIIRGAITAAGRGATAGATGAVLENAFGPK